MGAGVRRVSVVATAAVMLLVGAAPVAWGSNRPALTFVSPSPGEGATLSSGSVSFAFTYNRKPKATRKLTCSLAGPTSSSGPCDAPIAFGSQGSRSGKSYTGLQNGCYRFTVSLTLTDGGTASASRRFRVSVPTRHIYWTNADNNTIGRADVSGQNANQSFITGANDPRGVAVDSGHVYWANQNSADLNGGTIGRADLSGQNANQSFITGAHFPVGVAVDSGHVYWANLGGETIGRADLSGQNANQSFISGAHFPVGMAVGAGHIYWANDGTATIGRADLDGQNADESFITGLGQAEGVAVDSSHIYWTSASGIGRADLNGQNVNQSFITGADIAGVAVDSSHIYWTTGSAIGRADLNGQNVNQSFITGASFPYGVTVDPG
jgi:virginiamycin B lyase